MGLIGSIFGGAVGFALGGPIGAILGAALGHGLSGAAVGRFSETQRAQATYFVSVFSMLAKLARADGVVSEHEIRLVEGFMQRELALDADSQQAAIKIFRAAKDSPIRFEAFATQFHEMFAADEQVLLSMLDLLTRLAMADGRLDAGEQELLSTAATIFGIPAHEALHVFARHGAAGPQAQRDAGPRGGRGPRPVASQSRRAYDVLGLDPNVADTELKTRYRKLVAENHPDKIMAKGLPEEFVKFAEQRFREIQEAYETIKAERGLS